MNLIKDLINQYFFSFEYKNLKYLKQKIVMHVYNDMNIIAHKTRLSEVWIELNLYFSSNSYTN